MVLTCMRLAVPHAHTADPLRIQFPPRGEGVHAAGASCQPWHVSGVCNVYQPSCPRVRRYGLYFGVLGRDCAEVASDSIASALGAEGRKLAGVWWRRCDVLSPHVRESHAQQAA